VSVQVDRRGGLGAAVSVFATEIQRRNPMLAQRAKEKCATLHRSCFVISHSTIVGGFHQIPAGNIFNSRPIKERKAHFRVIYSALNVIFSLSG